MENKKKFSPLAVALIATLITAIICLVIGYFVVESYQPNTIGDTVTDEIEMADGQVAVATVEDAEDTSAVTRTATFVYLGAGSKLYESEDATSSCGIFLDTFEESELAKTIDSFGFPYQQEYVAVTTSNEPVRYLIKTASGETYWVEP